MIRRAPSIRTTRASSPTPGGRRPSRCLAIVGCAGAVVACSRPPALRKTHLARLPPSVTSIAIAEDGTTYAYVDKRADGQYVVHDGSLGPRAAAADRVTFAPVTRKLFYWAGFTAGPGSLVADGIWIPNFGRDAPIVFSADGKRWATAAALWDAQAGRPGLVAVYADGAEIGRYPDASMPAFSADGRHLAYLAAAPEGGTKLIVDGMERARYPVPAAECSGHRKPDPKGGPVFWPQFRVRYLSDGTLVVMTQDADGWGIYRDGQRIASYAVSLVQSGPQPGFGCPTATAIAAWSFMSAEKAPVLVWWERVEGTEDRWRVVVDGKPVDAFVCATAWPSHPPELSPDGRHVAYACSVKEPEARVFMVADGRRYGPYRDLWAYAWADHGAHVGYAASNDDPPDRPWRYYVDGKPRTAASFMIWRPRFEPGTDHLAWEERPTEDARGVVGIDGRRLASFDEVVWGPSFLERGTVSWVIRRGRRLTRIDAATG